MKTFFAIAKIDIEDFGYYDIIKKGSILRFVKTLRDYSEWEITDLTNENKFFWSKEYCEDSVEFKQEFEKVKNTKLMKVLYG